VRAAAARAVPLVAALAAAVPPPAPAAAVPSDTASPDEGPRERDPAPAQVYPVDGSHTYGEGFGARGGEHKGEDVMAACGTPLRAVKDATVRRVAFEAAAGRYVVFHEGDSGRDYVYMHMSAVEVAAGDSVHAGERVGTVGQTGDATACHLHFEEWSPPGWYAGGHAKNPLAFLRSLDAS
jgi:murein DD-endopeptidase MepM/ murein hydrolase activator NlpD